VSEPGDGLLAGRRVSVEECVDDDATAVRRLRAAGAVVVARTPAGEQVPNPSHPTGTVGPSSSGEGSPCRPACRTSCSAAIRAAASASRRCAAGPPRSGLELPLSVLAGPDGRDPSCPPVREDVAFVLGAAAEAVFPPIALAPLP
jgi:hypothetical protein